MKLIHFILKLIYINRIAYALNEYHHNDANIKYSAIYYRIEKVTIKDIFFDLGDVQYMVKDMNDEDWGDTTEKVYFSKRKASKELIKLCDL